MAADGAATTHGSRIDAAGDAAERLRSSFRGEILTPDDEAYEGARQIWNGMIDRRPGLIARCAGPEDVSAAVNFAREEGIAPAVRGGGHGVAGHALVDGGLVIDLSAMRSVRVDADRRVAHVEGGCTLADVDRETQRHGLATPLGVVSATGVAGLTLSGGIGHLRRKHGLSCDNLVSAQLVTADGSVATASEEENEDLFWAIRGGGGNFGVATSFAYRLHPIGPEAFLCFVLYPAERSRDLLQRCEQHLADHSDLGTLAFLGHIPEAEDFPAEVHGEPFLALACVHPGGAAVGEESLRPLRELGEPLADLSGPMPYTEAQKALDADYPDGLRYYWKSINVRELSDEVVDRLVELNAAAPSPHSTIDVWFQGGAMAEVGEHDTAFGNREARYLLGIEGNWEDPADDEENLAWVRQTFSEMRPHSDGGVYLNFPGFLEEGQQLMQEGYGDNLPRLAEVKRRYDPTNLFRLNANVQPA